MPNNFLPYKFDNFDKIQNQLQQKYYDESKLENFWSKQLDWNRNNFLDLYDHIEEKVCKTFSSSVAIARLFLTPPKAILSVHIDGNVYNYNRWALNIPKSVPLENHSQIWYRYNGQITPQFDEKYTDYCKPLNPELLVENERLLLNIPYFVKIGIFHAVENISEANRFILSLRFKNLRTEKIYRITSKV